MTPGQRVEVVLTLDVDVHGQVTSIGIVQSGGAAFDEAAVAAARQFAFRPAREHGRPVATRVVYRSHFVGPRAPDVAIAEPLLGEVFARAERQPQAGVTVLVDDGVARTVPDARGRFVIDGLSVGRHVVHVRGTDVIPYDETVTTRVNLPTLMTIYVEVKPRYLSRVRGRAAVQDPVEQTITSDEAAHLAGTQGDTLKAVQNLPGVARPPYNGG